MRVILIAAVLLGATVAAPALADPAPGVTVMFEYNFRPGHRTVTGADGTAVLPVEADGVYDVMVGEPVNFDAVLHASAGGSDAQVSLPRGTEAGMRVLSFRLSEGQDITVRVETAAAAQ
jgi:hypothetical protein